MRLAATERFFAKVREADNGCWIWTGNRNENNYGMWKYSGHQKAHRAAYDLFIGPIPAGLEIDHTCHNVDLSCHGGVTCLHRLCVNPSHLEAVTRSVNGKRGRTGEAYGAMQRAKTHCAKGHEYSQENTALVGGKYRECRTCRRTYNRQHQARLCAIKKGLKQHARLPKEDPAGL